MVIQKTDNSLISLKQESSTTGITIVLSLATLIASLAISSVNIILPELVSSLNTTFRHVQWVIIAYMLSLTSTLVVVGRLSDIFGRKRLFLMGLVIFSTSAGLGGFIQNLWLLVGMRVFQGIGGGNLDSRYHGYR
jgi:MFS family permease